MSLVLQLTLLGALGIALSIVYAVADARTTSTGSKQGPRPLDFFKTTQWTATVGHVLGGLTIVMMPAFWAPGDLGLAEWVTGTLVVAATAKEIADLFYESDEDVWSSLMDLVGYCFGAVVAWGNLLVAHAVGRW